MSERAGSVTALDIFPIKSCHAATIDGGAPQSLDVGMTGLEAYGVADRDFVIIEANPEDDDVAHFVTQRGWGPNNRLDRQKQADSRLARVRTDLSDGLLKVSVTRTVFGTLELPTAYDPNRLLLDVSIFDKQLPSAIDQGNEAAAFFSDLLGRTVSKNDRHRSGAVGLRAVTSTTLVA